MYPQQFNIKATMPNGWRIEPSTLKALLEKALILEINSVEEVRE